MHNKSHLLQLPVNVGFYSDLHVIQLNQPMKKITVYCVWTVGGFLCLLLVFCQLDSESRLVINPEIYRCSCYHYCSLLKKKKKSDSETMQQHWHQIYDHS